MNLPPERQKHICDSTVTFETEQLMKSETCDESECLIFDAN